MNKIKIFVHIFLHIIVVLESEPLVVSQTHLKPEGVSHIQGLEYHHHGQCWGEGPVPGVGLGQENQVNHQPANQARAQLTEKLQVKVSNARVQLVTDEEIIQDIS